MGKKILRALINNLGFKLLAFFCAVALWLVVYNIDDPTKTGTFTVHVQTQNEEMVAGMGLYYTPLDDSRQVTFQVSAKRSILQKLENSDFTAIADMNKLIISDDGKTGTVNIEITCSKSNSALKYGTKVNLFKVNLEKLMTKNFSIEANYMGDVAQGYALGDVGISSGVNMLKVSGPESVVSTVSSVVATIDVTGMASSVTMNVVPVPYTESGEVVDTTHLTFSVSTVTISANILSTKNVMLEFETSGTPAENYTVMDISSDPVMIKVKGAAAVLNPITKIYVPSDVLNVDNATSNIVTTIDIGEYLPNGVSLYDNSDATVSIMVHIEAYTTREFPVSTSNLAVEGLGNEYKAGFASQIVQVPISGLESDLDKIDAANLTGRVNVSGMQDGNHTVDLSLNLDDSKYQVAFTQTVIAIELKNADAASGGSTSGTAGTSGDDPANPPQVPETEDAGVPREGAE